MKNILLVFIGGGIGSALRYIIGTRLNGDFPYGTLVVNVLGSLLIGLALGAFLKMDGNKTHAVLIGVGFCGGFTTFSSFAYENLDLLKSGQYASFLLYALGSLILGILAVYIGLKITG